MNQPTLTELLKDYGNANFDCGAFDTETYSSESERLALKEDYHKLFSKAHSLRQQIIDLFNAPKATPSDGDSVTFLDISYHLERTEDNGESWVKVGGYASVYDCAKYIYQMTGQHDASEYRVIAICKELGIRNVLG